MNGRARSIDGAGHPTPPAAASSMAKLFALKPGAILGVFANEHFSFFAICLYLFVEYVRPQSIVPSLAALPLGKVSMGLALLAWVLDPNRVRLRDPTNKWIITFLLLVLLSSWNAYWPALSKEHFMDFFGWFVVYFLIINIVSNQRRFFVFLLIFLVASFKLAQHGARTWAFRGFSFTDWGLMGPPGFFENSGELAIQMLVFTPIAYHFAVGLRPWLTKVKYWLLMAFPLTGAMTVLGASSRGGQVGLAAEVLFTFFTGKRLIKAIAVTAVLAAAGWAVLPDEQKTRFLEAGDDTTSQQRLLYWSHGIDMIQSHPLLGIGYFNFPLYFERHYPESLIVSEAQLPHNIFIQIGVDLGILGLIVYSILIYRAFRSTMDVRSAARNAPQLAFYVTLSKGFDAAFIGFLVAGQFVSVVYYPFMWIHLALVVALRNIVQKAMAPAEEKRGVGVVLSPRGVDRESIKVLR